MNDMKKNGRITQVFKWNGKAAIVRLNKEPRTVTIPTSHRPKIGDIVVEGRLSREMSVK